MITLLSNTYSKDDFNCLFTIACDANSYISALCGSNCHECTIKRACTDMAQLYHHLENKLRGDVDVGKQEK